ncbi:MAG TPA: sulfite exporter TauE/SafE family protein [Anaeromyxobacteraceae bacterium]|nr:sulfite exporter TauE/SafE family protein [Anaeromyxobacteraceae bacterium]
MSPDAPTTWAFFAAGLAGGAGHCVAMCGPVVASLGLAAPAGRGTLAAAARALPYHLGRVTTYGLLGALMGLTGSFVNVAGRLAGFSDVVAALAGALMLAFGLGAAGVAGPLERLTARASTRLTSAARALLAGGAGQLYPLGLALGFLPCGLSWTAFLGAAATGGPVPGLLSALAFGLGTVPGLLAAGWLAAAFGQRARGVLYRAGGALVAAMGLLFLLRGLGVHVPA